MVDFQKAFDKASHYHCIDVMARSGLPKATIFWLCSYLKDRRQLVSVNGSLSNVVMVTSGVPQGSRLGPIIFAYLVSSLVPSSPDSIYVKYADDLSILTFTRELHDPLASIELNHVQNWCDNKKMFINQNKTKIMSFCTKRMNTAHSDSYHTLLGVTLSNDMKWSRHVENIVNKCNKKLYHIVELKRCGVGTKLLWKAYDAFIRPIMAYCYPAMCNMAKHLSNSMARVERKAERIIGSQPRKPLLDFLGSHCVRLSSSIKSSNNHPLRYMVHERKMTHHHLRNAKNMIAPFARTERFKHSLIKYF